DTHVYMPGRGKFQNDVEYDVEKVKEKLGVFPDRVIDLKGLMGDSSDNIPGVKGIGPKTANALLEAFDSIEGVYKALESEVDNSVFTKSVKNKLITDKENAILSKHLATILIDVDIDFILEDCKVSSYNKEIITNLFEELNFRSLVKLLPQDAFESSIQEALF
ncbi:MAG: hypothetical protein HOE40_03510, partial [Candidatus Pacebacteria bacterium]|nr:hypothetical protein [Candidatus Paceibacterota bacterium]